MAISGKETINIGLPNESANSDSLYTAFTKINNNFSELYSCASPYNSFIGNGVSINANANTGVITFTNDGVTYLNAGTGVTLSGNTGNLTISATGNGNVGVTSVGLLTGSSNRITVSPGSPIVSSGNFLIDLATTGVAAGTYTYPTVTVDAYGRISNISNAASVGTVTSVSLANGTGIAVTGGAITTSGTITVTNTGVTRLNQGTGIQLSGSNGNVTVSLSGNIGAVTSVDITSNNLVVTGSPIVTSGVITIDLPNNITVTGNVSANRVVANFLFGDGSNISNISGTPGAQGLQGIQGITGSSGGLGAQGIQGISGSAGSQGIQGVTGAGIQGIQGVTGIGVQGVQGTTGAGIQGIQGVIGTQGLDGSQGIQGLDGAFASQGIQGVQGIQGIQSVQGLQGIQGITGPSATNILTTTNSTDLNNAASTVNTFGKVQGLMVFNTTNFLIYVANGSSSLDSWYPSDGSGSINPL